jgi:predicted GIY-YIG superfamily endonuclease
MSHWVYILKSKKDGGYYIGHTQDLTERLERHNQGRVNYSNQNPPNPPLQKGGFTWDYLQVNY